MLKKSGPREISEGSGPDFPRELTLMPFRRPVAFAPGLRLARAAASSSMRRAGSEVRRAPGRCEAKSLPRAIPGRKAESPTRL